MIEGFFVGSGIPLALMASSEYEKVRWTKMVVYKSKMSHSLVKWIVFIAVLIAGLTITWSDVEGTPSHNEGQTPPAQSVSHK